MVETGITSIIERTLKNFFDSVSNQINDELDNNISRLAKLAEFDAVPLFNELYEYDFKLCKKINEKAIDAVDENKKIGIQISARKDKGKYETETFEAFPQVEYPYVNRLFGFVLTFDSKWRAYESWNFSKPGLRLDGKTDIYTLNRIKQDIILLSATDKKKLFRIIITLSEMAPKHFHEPIEQIKMHEQSKISIDNISQLVSPLKDEIF